MSEQDVQEGRFPRGPRVYDYWLGGTRHFPVDQAVGEQVVAFLPEIRDSVRGNRRFLARAVGFLRDAGIRQFQVNTGLAERSGTPLIPRGRDAIARMFNGHDLINPGLVLVSWWRPQDGDPGPDADRAWVYGGVAAL